MQSPGPSSEATVHRLHHSMPNKSFGPIHQRPALKQIVKVWGPRPLSHLALAELLLPMKGREGQCATLLYADWNQLSGGFSSMGWNALLFSPTCMFPISTCVLFSCSSGLLSYLHSQERGLAPQPDRCKVPEWVQEQHWHTNEYTVCIFKHTQTTTKKKI